jgi:D-glycero-D-manno-heptose 1,7-bisphosphate phosphatase
MLRQAAKEFGVRLKDSFVIGDRCIDMQAGKAAGCRTALVLTGYGSVEREECTEDGNVDYVCRDLFDAWRHVKRELKQVNRSGKRK